MRNKIEYIQQKELNGLLEQYRQNPKCRILGVDGKKCKSVYDLVVDFETELSFPWKCEGILDRFEDFMRDLSWYDYNQYVFYVTDYHRSFLLYKWKEKGLFLNMFEEILFFWEFGAERCIVGGKPLEMHLYLVMPDEYL